MSTFDPRNQHRYNPPQGRISYLIWRANLWMGTTLPIYLLEPWEQFLFVGVMLLLTGLLVTGIYRYLPGHIEFLVGRARFYFLGEEKGLESVARAALHSAEL